MITLCDTPMHASHSSAKSLGKFYPSRFHEITIAIELDNWLRARGIASARLMTSKGRLPIQVRCPEDHIRISTTDVVVSQWHRDGLGKLALDRDAVPAIKWIITWSNGAPTELIDCLGTILVFEPHDVVLFDNHTIRHRCPPTEDGRWFVRLEEPCISPDIV